MGIKFSKSSLIGAAFFIAAVGPAAAQSVSVSATIATEPANRSAVSQPITEASSATDQDAWSSKFQYAKKCLELAIEAEQLSNSFNLCQEQLIGTPGRKSCDLKTKDANIKSRALTGNAIAAGCPADTNTAGRNFSMSLVNAARAGVADAQLCYFQWSGPLSGTGDIKRYKQEASLYMQKGLENGDWRVAQLLATSPEGVDDNAAGIMVNLDIIGKWFTAFRANRLLELGATGPYKATLHKAAQDAARHLSKAQIENGNAWANHEFIRHFTNSAVLTKSPDTCLASTSNAAGLLR